MKLMKTDIWNLIGLVDALCITTNGCTKQDGSAVMGKGIAAEAVERFPGIDKTLGSLLTQHGNRVMRMRKIEETHLVALPTKHGKIFVEDEKQLLENFVGKRKLPAEIPGWMLKSDPELIKTSLKQLTEVADKFSWKKIALPLPGYGNGGLSLETSLSLVSTLDDRFICTMR